MLFRSVSLQRQDERDEDIMVDRTVDYAGLEKATNMKPGDVRSDIFFLGAILYELATGQPLMPVTRDRQAKMAAQRYMDVEETLRKEGPELGVPPELMKLLTRMVAFDPGKRFQNPTQLVDAIHQCRSELAGSSGNTVRSRTPIGTKTLFVVEQSEKLQDVFRDKFRANGYRVLLSINPDQAIKRYQQQPYHGLIVDARMIGREALDVYNKVVREAEATKLDLGAVLILGQDQAHWAEMVQQSETSAVMTDPVTMKQLIEKLWEVTPGDEESQPATSTDTGG